MEAAIDCAAGHSRLKAPNRQRYGPDIAAQSSDIFVLRSGCLRLDRSELDRELVFEIVVIVFIVLIIVSGHLVAR